MPHARCHFQRMHRGKQRQQSTCAQSPREMSRPHQLQSHQPLPPRANRRVSQRKSATGVGWWVGQEAHGWVGGSVGDSLESVGRVGGCSCSRPQVCSCSRPQVCSCSRPQVCSCTDVERCREQESSERLTVVDDALLRAVEDAASSLLKQQQATAHSSLLTPHSSLLTTHYSLLTSHYSLPTTHYLLLTTHSPLLTTHYSLLTTHYLTVLLPIDSLR